MVDSEEIIVKAERCLYSDDEWQEILESDRINAAIEALNTRAERTCKVTPSKNLQGIVVCECGEPFPEYYDYCPYCGAKVIADES